MAFWPFLHAKDKLVIPTYINSIILQSTFHFHCITLSLHTFIKVMYSPFMILQFYFFRSLLSAQMNNTHSSCYYGTHCPKGVQSDCMGIAKQQLDITFCMHERLINKYLRMWFLSSVHFDFNHFPLSKFSDHWKLI